MDIKTRKLKLIKYLVNLEDETILRRMESAVSENKKKKPSEDELKPFTQNELIERAKRSDRDYNRGKFISQEQLEKDSENW